MRRHQRDSGRGLGGDVFWQFEMNGTRPLLLRDPECLPDDRGNGRGAHNLMRHLGQRLHRRDDVDDLKLRLLAAQHALLACEHHHGHRAEQSVSRPRREVERAGAERGEAHPRSAGQPPVCSRHEGCRLFMTRHHELDFGEPQRLDDAKILFPGDPEDLLDALILQCGYEQFGAVQWYVP